MSTQPSPTPVFFGINLRALQQDWRMALQGMGEWPVVSWLTPGYVTRLKTSAHHSADFIQKNQHTSLLKTPAKNVRFTGYLLPDELLLWHPMTLPLLNAEALTAALTLEAQSLSPFPPDDLIWSHTPVHPSAQGLSTRLVLSSRKLIKKHIEDIAPSQGAQTNYEVWVKKTNPTGYLVLEGFDEKKRHHLATQWRRVNLLLVLTALAIATAAAVTPTAQLRLRALQATQSFSTLQTTAGPAVLQRERLTKLDLQIKALQTQREKTLAPEKLLHALTTRLTDDTYLTSLHFQNGKVILSGQTPNTATLMQQLGSKPGVKDVKAPVPASRQRGADRETFNIEFTLDPTQASTP